MSHANKKVVSPKSVIREKPTRNEATSLMTKSEATELHNSLTSSLDKLSISAPDFSDKKNGHIVQIGFGCVGSAYGKAYDSKGFMVTGLEASKALIDKYKNTMNIYHIDSKQEIENIKDVDFIMISVCTPLNLKDDKLDLSYLFNTIPNVATILKKSPDAFVIIRSTVPPTTTKEYKQKLSKLLEKEPKVLFQPEFLRAVSAVEDAKHPWHVVLGVDKGIDVTKLISLYSKFVDRSDISILTVEEAEIMKVYHNCFNAAKISFFNQCDMLCEEINKRHNTTINMNAISETLTRTCEGLRNPKYGTKTKHAYYGSCLPKDSAELAALEKAYGLKVPLFSSVVQVNNEVKKKDKVEVLHGDHHMSFDKFKV